VIDHRVLLASNDKELEKINREIKIMKKLNHPHIVRLNEVIQMPEKKATCLVLEYLQGGELFNYIVAKRRLPEAEAAKFFSQMLSALEYCHSNLVIHRGACTCRFRMRWELDQLKIGYTYLS
jgi:serine/threonine protein kinase